MADGAPLVAMCRGTACRKHREYDATRERLGADHDVASFPCIGVCHGPIVAVVHADASVVVERVRSNKARRDLIELVAGGRLTERLAKREVSGKKAAKATRRVAR